MKGLKKKMTPKEWRETIRSLVVGVLGGAVLLTWQVIYEITNEFRLPTIGAILMFLILFFVLRYLLLDDKFK